MFQFLLVRLKEDLKERIDIIEETFQFLLVRLKADLNLKDQVIEPSFNSFWCD